MPNLEAPLEELGSAPRSPSVGPSPSPSEISSTSTPEPLHVRPSPLFSAYAVPTIKNYAPELSTLGIIAGVNPTAVQLEDRLSLGNCLSDHGIPCARALAMRPPEPEQPRGQDELERRLPGYRRIVIPRELTLIELLKQSSGVTLDEEVLSIREAKLRVIAEKVGLRRLHVLAPHLRVLVLDGSALISLRELGIGLVHLKVLSINRCGLTCLDGIWGLLKLRELRAAGNKLQELHPLAALQKLHTLDLSNNPIAEAGRLWTLAVCPSLRSLILKGSPASDDPDYVEKVAAALPSLTHLDERPLQDEDELEGIAEDSGSDSEEEHPADKPESTEPSVPRLETEPGPSDDHLEDLLELPLVSEGDSSVNSVEAPSRINQRTRNVQRLRPATTENAGVRPERPTLPRRPKTALDRPSIDAPTRLQIMNTLMDEEWRCSGSKLTSRGAVCGNLARALRRHGPPIHTPDAEVDELEAVEDASRVLAAEIPRAPRLEDWAKFREETGIDFQIDFNEWPKPGDPESAIARLEQIEKETYERFKKEQGHCSKKDFDLDSVGGYTYGSNMTSDSNLDDWKSGVLTPIT